MRVSHGLFTCYYHHQSQQTTIFAETAQESGGSSPTTSAFYATVIRPVLEYCTPVNHRLSSWSGYKSVLFKVFILLLGACHILLYLLFVAEFTSLESRHDQLSSSFFQYISHPSSSLYHLLPPPRDTSVLSRLRTATWFTRPVSCTKNIVPLLITP